MTSHYTIKKHTATRHNTFVRVTNVGVALGLLMVWFITAVTISFFPSSSHAVVMVVIFALQWRHNELNVISNHQPDDCFTQQFIQGADKRNIKAPRHWPLCREFTRERWIPAQKWVVSRTMFTFDDVIMQAAFLEVNHVSVNECQVTYPNITSLNGEQINACVMHLSTYDNE